MKQRRGYFKKQRRARVLALFTSKGFNMHGSRRKRVNKFFTQNLPSSSHRSIRARGSYNNDDGGGGAIWHTSVE